MIELQIFDQHEKIQIQGNIKNLQFSLYLNACVRLSWSAPG